MASRVRLLVRNSALFTPATAMPVSSSAAATRWVWAEVLEYTKQPVSVETATYSGRAISCVTGVISRTIS